MLHHGMDQRRPADLPLGGVAEVVVDGAGGVEDHKWLPTRRLRGLVGEGVVVVVTSLGLNLLARLSPITTLVVAVVPQPP